MAAHSFAYWPNPGGIPGCYKVGNLLVSYPGPFSGYSETPLFWTGPEEDGRWVIATTLTTQSQPTPAPPPNDYSWITFWATKTLSDSDFITLSEFCSNWYGSPQTFYTTGDARTWLNNNGFWTNRIG